MPTDLPARSPDPDPDAGTTDESVGPPGLQGIFAAITLAALATLVLLPFLRDEVGRGRPLRVALVDPGIEQGGPVASSSLDRLALTARDALERHLSGRQGLTWTASDDDDETQPADGAVAGAAASTAANAAATTARRLGADEAAVLEIECDSLCRASLRRIRAVDGSVTWQRPRVVLSLEDPLAVEAEIGGLVDMAYLDFGRRDGAPRLYARAEDYRRYLELRRRLDALPRGGADDELTETLTRELSRELTELRLDSPRFYSAYLWEAALLHRALGPADVPGERLLDLLRQAHRIAPADRRPLLRLVPLLRRAGRPDEARDALGELRELYPGDPAVERLREPHAQLHRQPRPTAGE